jgi:hypothetical protein
VKLFDDVRDRVAYAGYFAQAIPRDDLTDRQAEREKIIAARAYAFDRRGFPPRRALLCPNSRSNAATADASGAAILNQCARADARRFVVVFRCVGLRQVRIIGPFMP